jgi:hydrogenase-4 component C
MVSADMIFIGLSQAIGLLAIAPLFSGFSRVLRAKMHNRRGPSIFQNYRDLAKLMKRQEVVSSQADWVFRITPFVAMVSMLLAATLVPMFTVQSPYGWAGDLILFIYLCAMWRFFFSVSGLDTGSPLGGIGAKRELIMSVLIEPVMLLVLFVMALLAGSTNLGTISTKVASGQIPYYTSVWLGMLAFAFATLVEMGKLPFDLAEAEQELQEGPLAEFSGQSLALMKWAIYLKQIVLVSLFLAIFLPFGSVNVTSFSDASFLLAAVLAVIVFLLKVAVCYFIVALLENAMARVRFLKASVATWTALGAAILSFVFYLANV